jgi:hypothetical protein
MSEAGSVPFQVIRVRVACSIGSVRKSQASPVSEVISFFNRLNRLSIALHLRMEADTVSETLFHVRYLEYWTMCKAQKKPLNYIYEIYSKIS